MLILTVKFLPHCLSLISKLLAFWHTQVSQLFETFQYSLCKLQNILWGDWICLSIMSFLYNC
jgi:hypothetical protein